MDENTQELNVEYLWVVTDQGVQQGSFVEGEPGVYYQITPQGINNIPFSRSCLFDHEVEAIDAQLDLIRQHITRFYIMRGGLIERKRQLQHQN